MDVRLSEAVMRDRLEPSVSFEVSLALPAGEMLRTYFDVSANQSIVSRNVNVVESPGLALSITAAFA